MDVGSQILQEYRSTVMVLIAFIIIILMETDRKLIGQHFSVTLVVDINSAKMFKTSEKFRVLQELFVCDSN